MITFWVNAAGSFAMDQYLAKRALHLADRIQVRRYESLAPEVGLDLGAHIFAAVDQLPPAGLDAVGAIYDRLSALGPTERLLNNPSRVRRRYDLLRTMRDAGINGFRAYRPAEITDQIRYPVFVREESKHNGALTGLLPDRRRLSRALLALRARGYRRGDLLVVEFCDLSDSEGFHHTASALKVGDFIIPVHLLSDRHWMLKWDNSGHGERAMQAHLDYVRGNPHQTWLRRVFALANVDYGRIDYGVRGETLQVWEINTNPMLGPSGGQPPPPLAPKLEEMLTESRTILHRVLEQALRSLDGGRERSSVTVQCDPELLALMRAETSRTRRRDAVVRFLQHLYFRPGLGRLFRAAYRRLLPRR